MPNLTPEERLALYDEIQEGVFKREVCEFAIFSIEKENPLLEANYISHQKTCSMSYKIAVRSLTCHRRSDETGIYWIGQVLD